MSLVNDRHAPATLLARVPESDATPALRAGASERGPWLQIGKIARYEWNRIILPIAKLPAELAGLRIIHLSDLHFRAMWFDGYDQVVARLRDDPPDLIVITGDFVEARADHRPALPMLDRFLTRLTSRLGIYGILGNHDGDLLAPRLGAMNVTLINGHVARLESSEAAIELVGVPGISRRDLTDDFLGRVGPRRDGAIRVILSHYPDAIHRLAPLRGDIILSGHTHGGQICLPNGFAPLTHDWLPRRMSKGVHRIGKSWLIISKGLGFATWRVRAFCPAEVVEVVLQSAGG